MADRSRVGRHCRRKGGASGQGPLALQHNNAAQTDGARAGHACVGENRTAGRDWEIGSYLRAPHMAQHAGHGASRQGLAGTPRGFCRVRSGQCRSWGIVQIWALPAPKSPSHGF
ncbi:MAG: hypothetical protein OXU61_11590 [Gammaproteobacteria bacterium]|nr:hypothetical protein [Gammaproteobacteria bacterium]